MAATTLAAIGLTAPQVSAAEGPSASGVAISPTASKATRTIAAAQTEAVRATSNLCGSTYVLQSAERLPDARRFGTLFTYTRGNAGYTGACAVFDNNTGTAKYMKLKLCTNRTEPRCDTDEGTFSQYAGPVTITGTHSEIFCSKSTAIMKSTKTSTAALIDRVDYATPCN
ncbi:hypothetical protein [Streptomyces sp. ISL-100]|uniref:hypothetical protein n=1 Tax=Streptomyces sp. ISL-100 TaxID=2819173 RepID=UPI0027E58C80|nr:hypothetical protein [Streptomyces sp. ISL-100]